MIGSEDLALAKHSILIITSGDLGTVFSQVIQVQDHQNHNWHQKLIEQHQKHQLETITSHHPQREHPGGWKSKPGQSLGSGYEI